MDKLHMIRSEVRAFTWVDSSGREYSTRANGVALLGGALVFQDVNGEPILTIGPRAWLSVSPK